jgi:predicted amidohydrolase
MSEIIKIALYQGFHGFGVPLEIAEQVQAAKTDLLCLPEYFFVGPNEASILPSAERHDSHLQYLIDLSQRLNCAVAGGTLVVKEADGYKNRCYFIDSGEILGHYDKIHLYKNEGRGQVVPGAEYKVIGWRGLKIGLLVCADVLTPESFVNMKALSPDLLVVPVTSPYHEGESADTKFTRDNALFIEGAKTAGCPIIKVGSVGNIAGRRLQGRSLVTTKDGILFRVPPEGEADPALKIIDLTL